MCVSKFYALKNRLFTSHCMWLGVFTRACVFSYVCMHVRLRAPPVCVCEYVWRGKKNSQQVSDIDLYNAIKGTLRILMRRCQTSHSLSQSGNVVVLRGREVDCAVRWGWGGGRGRGKAGGHVRAGGTVRAYTVPSQCPLPPSPWPLLNPLPPPEPPPPLLISQVDLERKKRCLL